MDCHLGIKKQTKQFVCIKKSQMCLFVVVVFSSALRSLIEGEAQINGYVGYKHTDRKIVR